MQRHVLDHAGVYPNPARDPRIKLPRQERDETEPPPAEHVIALAHALPGRYVLPVAVLEQTGMRLNELGLQWGDVDEAGCRFRLKSRETKTGRARWVQVPDWLMRAISDTLPAEDRTATRRVFPGITVQGLRAAMATACKTAGIPHYHPHDLRHRRISLWHGQGVPWKAISERVGQSRPSITLDVYSHVMPLDEVPRETWERILVRLP